VGKCDDWGEGKRNTGPERKDHMDTALLHLIPSGGKKKQGPVQPHKPPGKDKGLLADVPGLTGKRGVAHRNYFSNAKKKKFCWLLRQ